MDAKEISFMNVMEVGFIRKKIFEYLPSFKDINRLASTCWRLNQIIKDEKITKNLFYDCVEINITFTEENDIKEYVNAQEESIYEDGVFLENFDFFNDEVKKDDNFDRDRFICNNTVEISVSTKGKEVSTEKYVSFIKKLAKQYKINSEERRNLTFLKLNFIDFREESDSLRLLHVLPYLHHKNINTIVIPMRFFLINIIEYNELLNNLFDGFPKLYKLEISLSVYCPLSSYFYHNKDAIDVIMGQLSRKKNATIHFNCIGEYCSCNRYYFLVFFEIAMKYGIKVTMDHLTSYLLEQSSISDILKYHNYSIEQLVTTCMCYNSSFDHCSYDRFRRMRYYENLEKVYLIFNYSLYDCSLEENFKAFGNIQSLKNLKKVVAIELTFVKDHDGISKDEIEIFHTNVKYLIQLLPKSVKRLHLFGIPKLNYDITRTIKKYMPNIEVLSLCKVSFEETDCLSVFKKLKVVAIRSDIPVKIPDSVKLFAINTMESTEKDINKQLIDEYTDKFSKRLTDNNGKDIYFKNFNDWRCYKHILQTMKFFYSEYTDLDC